MSDPKTVEEMAMRAAFLTYPEEAEAQAKGVYSPQWKEHRAFAGGYLNGHASRDPEVKELVKALEYYADPDNWTEDQYGDFKIDSDDSHWLSEESRTIPGQTAIKAIIQHGKRKQNVKK